MQRIRPLSRKEKSPYKPSDIWTNEEHSIFLKFCPEKSIDQYITSIEQIPIPPDLIELQSKTENEYLPESKKSR